MESNSPVILQIGLNKTGTCSIYELLTELHYNPLTYHLEGTFVLDKMAECMLTDPTKDPLIPYLQLKYNAFTDFVSVNSENELNISFKIIQRVKLLYKNAKFILNIRSPETWLLSRWNHYYANPNFVPEYFSKDPSKYMQTEMIRWYKWTHDILTLFENEPHKLLVVHLEDLHMAKKIATFLGHEYENTLPSVNRTTHKTFTELPTNSTWW